MMLSGGSPAAELLRRAGDGVLLYGMTPPREQNFPLNVSRPLLHAGDLLTGDRARGEDLVQHGLAIADG